MQQQTHKTPFSPNERSLPSHHAQIWRPDIRRFIWKIYPRGCGCDTLLKNDGDVQGILSNPEIQKGNNITLEMDLFAKKTSKINTWNLGGQRVAPQILFPVNPLFNAPDVYLVFNFLGGVFIRGGFKKRRAFTKLFAEWYILWSKIF